MCVPKKLKKSSEIILKSKLLKYNISPRILVSVYPLNQYVTHTFLFESTEEIDTG